MTLEVECLVQALQEVMATRARHDHARAEYDRSGGYSWGYHGHHYVKVMEGAAEEFGNRLTELIDKRVAIAVDKALSSGCGS